LMQSERDKLPSAYPPNGEGISTQTKSTRNIANAESNGSSIYPSVAVLFSFCDPRSPSLYSSVPLSIIVL